jgi:hypothetical protein
MAQSCQPEALVSAANCLQCLSEQQQLMVQTYLLAQIAGVPATPETLLASAVQFQTLSQKQLLMIQAQLLCLISGGTP